MSSQETKVCGNCQQPRNLGSFGHNRYCASCRRKLEQPFKQLYWGCRDRANRKQESLTVTAEYLEQLWNAQQGLCYWSKVPMTLELGSRLPNQVSVDRLDNSKGYTPDNIVLVTLAMNLGRSESPVETWLEYLNSLGILGLFSFVKSA